jgi:hypothetical protein
MSILRPDCSTAPYTNTLGDAVLSAHWQDSDFDADEPAFYYVRVLEIPTPDGPRMTPRFTGSRSRTESHRRSRNGPTRRRSGTRRRSRTGKDVPWIVAMTT